MELDDNVPVWLLVPVRVNEAEGVADEAALGLPVVVPVPLEVADALPVSVALAVERCVADSSCDEDAVEDPEPEGAPDVVRVSVDDCDEVVT